MLSKCKYFFSIGASCLQDPKGALNKKSRSVTSTYFYSMRIWAIQTF